MELVPTLTSECTISALIAAFLVFVASYFKRLDIPIRESKMILRILFVFCGYLIGIVLHISQTSFDSIYCMAIGGGWIYVVLGFKNTAKAFTSAKVLRDVKKVLVESLIESLRNQIENEEGEKKDEGKEEEGHKN